MISFEENFPVPNRSLELKVRSEITNESTVKVNYMFLSIYIANVIE